MVYYTPLVAVVLLSFINARIVHAHGTASLRGSSTVATADSGEIPAPMRRMQTSWYSSIASSLTRKLPASSLTPLPPGPTVSAISPPVPSAISRPQTYAPPSNPIITGPDPFSPATPSQPPSSGLLANIFASTYPRDYAASSKSQIANLRAALSSWIGDLTGRSNGQDEKSHLPQNRFVASATANIEPIYGPFDRYAPASPYFSTLSSRHREAQPYLAISFTPERSHMYTGGGVHPWEAQEAALKKCYHDGRDRCELGGDPISSGECVAVAKAKGFDLLFSASNQQSADVKKSAVQWCQAETRSSCSVEFFDCV